MGVDLQWNLLTDASANLGNALVQGAGQIRQHRETHRDRAALTNYLQHPDDQAAFTGLAERNPDAAFRIQDHHVERARQLRDDQQQQLRFIGRIVHDVHDEATYQNALQLVQRAGIDVSGVPPHYDPGFVGQLQELDRRLNPVAPVSVAEGARLVNPETGTVVASTPARPRYYPIQPGGTLQLDPSYEGPTTDGPQSSAMPPSSAPPRPGEAPAFAPQPAAPGVDEPALRAAAEAAIRAGRDPALVWQRYQQLLTGGGAAPQGQQTFP